MKFSVLISVLFICFVFAACASDEEEATCVTAFDCPDGYSCVDSVCQISSGESDDSSDNDGPQDVSDSSELPGGDNSNDELPDSASIPEENDGDSDDLNDSSEISADDDSADDTSSADEDTVQETQDEPVVLECPNDCSGHGNCDTTTGICTCTDNHDGEDCSGCLTGYSNNSGTCVKKQCNPNCKTITGCYFYDDNSENTIYPYGAETEAHGTCNDSTGGDCVCDQGWITNGTGETLACGASLSVLNNVECSVCDKNNPPAKYAETGCPTDCPTIMGTLMFCDVFMGMMGTGYPMGVGKCYYEPGTLKLYCKCETGYTMSGSKYYDENSIGACAAESSE
jgi:hypothetical protein